MNLAADIKALLEGDGTLMAILTGGVYDGLEINRQDTAGAFDSNNEIEPCCLVREATGSPDGPHENGARVFVDIYFYERTGYSHIGPAMDRVYALLHRQKIVIAGGSMWEMRHTFDTVKTSDQALACSLAQSQFVMWINRG